MDLVISQLSKTYPNGVRALDDVSLTIEPGLYGLLGPNGAGKSSLMRTIATLQEPDTGSIQFGELNVLTQKEELRKTLGYLPQEFGLYPKVPAEDLLDHFAVLKGVTRRGERKALVKALLEQTNLWQVRKKKVGGYSGGMRQRFGIAVALLGDPRLLIVDEPTAGLDPEERVRFLNLLAELGENAVVILSTHIVDDVAELCARMAIINQGHILLETEPAVAVDELGPRVFERVITKEEVPEYQKREDFLSQKRILGRTVVRTCADSAPEGFSASSATLEDVYFAALRGFVGNQRSEAVATAAAGETP
ncbi:MAG: ABC transporter ATP-binding protein [Acidobacteriota bacterium]